MTAAAQRPMLLPMDGGALKSTIRKRMPLVEYAKKLGLSKQAVSNWIAADSIPMQRLTDTIELLNLSSEEVGVILHPFLERTRLAKTVPESAHISPELLLPRAPVSVIEASGETIPIELPTPQQHRVVIDGKGDIEGDVPEKVYCSKCGGICINEKKSSKAGKSWSAWRCTECEPVNW